MLHGLVTSVKAEFWAMQYLPWELGLEHEASVGVNTKLVDVAGASVVHT